MKMTYIADLYRGTAVDAEFKEDLVGLLKNLFYLGPDGQLHLRRTCICEYKTLLITHLFHTSGCSQRLIPRLLGV